MTGKIHGRLLRTLCTVAEVASLRYTEGHVQTMLQRFSPQYACVAIIATLANSTAKQSRTLAVAIHGLCAMTISQHNVLLAQAHPMMLKHLPSSDNAHKR